MPTYDPGVVEESIRRCGKIISKGSKSFSLAARVFDRETRDAAFSLYGWCRLCDDFIDGSVMGMHKENLPQDEQLKRLDDLSARTRDAYAGKKMGDPVFIAFQHVVQKYHIPMEYPLDLLEGMAMDVRGDRYNTINDLLVYCYRVAGTVGLMMSHIMGVSSEKALMHAASLGKAMQLTNIARDVMEDAQMGRVYLPIDWLKEFNVGEKDVANPIHREKISKIVSRLLAIADVMYQSGDRGLKYLPWRAACAISSARRVYSEIGHRVQNLGQHAWDQRTVIPTGRKVGVMCKGIGLVFLSIPKRFVSPWQAVPIRSVWRNT